MYHYEDKEVICKECGQLFICTVKQQRTGRGLHQYCGKECAMSAYQKAQDAREAKMAKLKEMKQAGYLRSGRY